MFQWRLRNPLTQFVDADKVGEERVGEVDTGNEVHGVLGSDSPTRNFGFVTTPSRCSIKESFDRAKQEFHVYRLRTSPAAPNSTKQSGKQKHCD